MHLLIVGYLCIYLPVPGHVSLNGASYSKQSQVAASRRRSSNGRMIILRTPTTLVRSKGVSSQNKTLARYCISLTGFSVQFSAVVAMLFSPVTFAAKVILFYLY